MKKWAMAALIAFFGLPALAQSGGFHGDEPPPPPNKQESGYRGTVDARHTSIASAKRMKTNAWVTLDGHIEKKIGNDKYFFRDATGTVLLEIRGDKWNGQEIKPKDLISISGRLLKDRHGTHINVGRILKQ
ncbi:YgiW/YdeI family stress tolerance OB fold protein [Sodalis ligni]|uniref:YgiW/YdeI family stress tolerance OB fold protein n=1 Tax=Sodalis ligni TaxID=2697027 RepID=UPI00193FD7CD|nr:NirD/YgiW/YdeI family stress tolerance protein [Sodalis ligni]QWA09637.1 YgiW/YdeI family stress tolerance OB fold protein [Sodalis ligni]